MAADVAVAAALIVPILLMGLILGVRFDGGLPGVLVFMLLASMWSLAYAGFGYAIALRTGNPAAVNSSFLLFFPFLFLDAPAPRDRIEASTRMRRAWANVPAGEGRLR